MFQNWCSLISVKFNYLFLFKQLIDRIRPMIIYWWVTAVFKSIACVFVAAIYGAVCPYYYNKNACESPEVLGLTTLTVLVVNVSKSPKLVRKGVGPDH